MASVFAAPPRLGGYTLIEGPPPSKVLVDYYFHAAPEEREPPQPPTRFLQADPEHRYKIIFVKVPPSVPKVQETLELPPQVLEKTVVYVLVKRPDDPEDIILPEPKPTKPSKPEVFVIKYKNEKDISSSLVSGVSESKLYGQSEISEDLVNMELSKVKAITNLKFINDLQDN